MRAPDRYPTHEPYDIQPYTHPAPATPIVYPLDDHVAEGPVGPDGRPIKRKRKNPIGFAR